MRIHPKDTVKDVVLRDNALFRLAVKDIVEALKDVPSVDYVRMKRPFWFDKKIKVRGVEGLTMGELNAIEVRNPSYQSFCIVLGVMLGLVTFKRRLPDGSPDWSEGFSVDEKQIGRLRFIRAQKYFMDVQLGLEQISKAWKRLEMPLLANERKAQIKRPNRGLVSVVRKYCQLMNGAVNKPAAWNTKWADVYEAFESCKNDNLEQRKLHELSMPKIRRR